MPVLNIIYIRNSVSTCLPFLYSLIENTNAELRLVSNGCTREEEIALESLCKKFPNMEFKTLGVQRTLEHGLVLDSLLSTETSDSFFYMDSDIFANHTCGNEFLSLPSNLDGYSSCSPVWHGELDAVMPSNFGTAAGRFHRTESGFYLGCTYFAGYRTSVLKQLVEETGASFRVYTRGSLSKNLKGFLTSRGVDFNKYDTSKVVNIMLALRGSRLEFIDRPGLLHGGGVSCDIDDSNKDITGLKKMAREKLPTSAINLYRRIRLNARADELDSLNELSKRRTEMAAIVAALHADRSHKITAGVSFCRSQRFLEFFNLYQHYSDAGYPERITGRLAENESNFHKSGEVWLQEESDTASHQAALV